MKKTIFLENEQIPYFRFDLYVEELNLAIEYDGEGHFMPIDFAGKGIEHATEQFERCQMRDEIKNRYCFENNIHLLRIPYTQQDNIEELIIETINNII